MLLAQLNIRDVTDRTVQKQLSSPFVPSTKVLATAHCHLPPASARRPRWPAPISFDARETPLVPSLPLHG
jgi:hypothetical protein